jgi:hypothetical protein
MSKASRVITKTAPKKRPPVTGTLVGVRLQPDQLGSLDAWIKKQKGALTRPEAIRHLLALGLRK